MLGREKPDLVAISLPNKDHFETTLRVMQADYPLFVEKPLVFELEEADILLEEAGERGLFFAINFNHRYARPVHAGMGRRALELALAAIRSFEAGRYVEHRGNIQTVLRTVLESEDFRGFDRIGVAGNIPAAVFNAIDPTLSAVEGARFLLPGCRNVFHIGGQGFSLLSFDDTGGYREHSINPPCASGTGSFIEQQAERLSLSTAEFAQKASRFCGKTPSIATRCAVFAKTDIIHAMQEGFPLDAICSGLCEGAARSVLDVLVKGRRLIPPVGIVGGVSLNAKVVDAIGSELQMEVEVPRFSHLAGAVGAAILGQERKLDFSRVEEVRSARQKSRPPLRMELSQYPDFHEFAISETDGVEIFLDPSALRSRPAPHGGRRDRGAGSPNGGAADGVETGGGYCIGIDIGSTSTKAAVIDPEEKILGGFYTTTGGDPIAALRRLIRTIEKTFPPPIPLAGVATTGSGRKIIKELFQADLEINEITAHARAAVFLDPLVDTIIEIGGQDSKFTLLSGGQVTFSTMNYACAAGTGSFIEEQAKRLGVSLKEFSDMAFEASSPYTSDRCTVYMERDLAVLLSQGWSKKSLAAAVLHSVRDNYLSKVVNKNPMGEHVVFQGATGRNPALVASFEQRLGKAVAVSPYCHLTGAIGAALICREERERSGGGSESSASGFLWDLESLRVEQEVCGLCANRCLLTVVARNGQRSGWGMKCGREYATRSVKKENPSAMERRFGEVMAGLLAPLGETDLRKTVDAGPRGSIGIPAGLYNAELYPLWHRFLSLLGFRVEVMKSTASSLAAGKALVNSDFCAPMIMSHGLVQRLLHSRANGGVDAVFFPAVVNEDGGAEEAECLFRKKTIDDYFCYYSQYLPTILGNLTTMDAGERLLSPLISFRENGEEAISQALHEELSRLCPDIGLDAVREAYSRSRRSYLEARKRWSRTFYAAGPEPGKLRILLLSRPYVAFDPILNLRIPQKLENLGASVYWQDELDLEGYEAIYANRYIQRMHWHYGRKILKAAEYCAAADNLYAVFLTCFRCSPDSFLISYVQDIMSRYGKPFLILQLDEHSSDVGYTTRMEAGLRSFENHRGRTPGAVPVVLPAKPRNDALAKGDNVLVLYLDDLISRFWVDAFTYAGYNAMLLEADERALNVGYQYANGGECMPLISMMGGVINKVRDRGLDPRRTFFFIPTNCVACNFTQFPILSDLVFESAGIRGLKIGLINSMAIGEAVPQSVALKIFESYIVASILYKLKNRVKPYERNPGDTQSVFDTARELVRKAILRGERLRAVVAEIARLFRAIPRDEPDGRKPRIALLGDLYVKYSDVVNQRLTAIVEELGGELIIPSMTEYPFHYFSADITAHGDDPRYYQLLQNIEKRYEFLVEDLIGDQLEPDTLACTGFLEDYNLKHYIVGETSINLGRALYHLRERNIEAILHVNPIFCCPGVVTASIYRKMQEDFQIPIIDIFYDGTGDPNRVLIPYLHYLRSSKSSAGAALR